MVRFGLSFALFFLMFSFKAFAQLPIPIEVSGEGGTVLAQQDGAYVFTLQEGKGLQVIDSTDPDNPKVISRLELPGKPLSIFAFPSLAGLIIVLNSVEPGDQADGSSHGRILRIDVRKPQNPSILWTLNFDGYAKVARHNTAALYLLRLVNSETGVLKQYITGYNLVSKWQVGIYFAPFTAYRDHMDLSYYLGIEDDGNDSKMHIYYIGNSFGSIFRDGFYKIRGKVPEGATHVEENGTIHIISTSSGKNYLQSYKNDEVNPAAPYPEFSFPQRFKSQKIRFVGNRAYLYSADPALAKKQTRIIEVLDISNPKKPKLLPDIHIPGWVMDLKIIENRAIAIGDDPDNSKQLAAAIFDVSTSQTKELGRVLFGDGSRWKWQEFWQDNTFKTFLNNSKLLSPFFEAISDRIPALLFDLDLKAGKLQSAKQLDMVKSYDVGSKSISAFSVGGQIGSLSDSELLLFNPLSTTNPIPEIQLGL